MEETKHIPARVAALAELVGDEPIAWRETDDTIVIVFANKGKQTFAREQEAQAPNAIEADAPPVPARPKSRTKGAKAHG